MKKKLVDRILMFLKMHGEATATLVSEELAITKEGARQHLLKLAEEDLIIGIPKSERVGRPVTFYSLTQKGLSRFPDTHAEVTIQLLQSVRKLLGDNAMDLLINDREKQTYDRYSELISKATDIESRLAVLKDIRTKEGYMAEWEKEGDDYYFIEHHCPICAAATECQGFCRAELKNFQQLLGEDLIIERTQHIVSGGNRCVYRISSPA